jgi:hypothetical protein
VFLLASIGDSVERGFDEFFQWLPKLVGFLVVLLIGWIIARVVARIVRRALHSAGLDRMLLDATGGSWIRKVTSSPSRLLATITFWLLFLGAVSIAVDVLGIAALEDLVAAVWSYIPNVIAALVIFLVAAAISAGVAALATRVMGDTGLGKLIATAAPILVMTIATFMILDQLEIAENIVTITYAGLVGALALGSALAFGLGGREVAGRLLEGAYAGGVASKEQVKRDYETGKARAKAEASRLREDLERDDDVGTTSTPRP